MTRKMTVGDYSRRSISNYIREIRFIGEYYPDKPVGNLSKDEIELYMLYLKQTLGVGRDKCRMTASSLQWLFKYVLEKPYDLPSKLYPKKTFSLPAVMSHQQVLQLFEAPLSLKQRAVSEVFYSTGVRLEECTQLRIADIDSANICIHLRQGKGRKGGKCTLAFAYGGENRQRPTAVPMLQTGSHATARNSAACAMAKPSAQASRMLSIHSNIANFPKRTQFRAWRSHAHCPKQTQKNCIR